MEIEQKYMARALELARNGAGFVSPNPMVGAVVVAPDNRIIGEGWHRRYGCPHAEVNAVNSIPPEDRKLIPQSTIYVTLEPCSHYGKTPPCAKMLIERGFRKVVVGSFDPFKEVSGRGIQMMRQAGIEVIENFMKKECDDLNRRFIFAHTHGRPYIQLKWAQSADGFIAYPPESGKRLQISTPVSMVAMHRQRALADAILVGTQTLIDDNPSLSNRLAPGNSPRPVIFQSQRLSPNMAVMSRNPILLNREIPLIENMEILYRDHKVNSIMVEGGAQTLNRFLDLDLANEIRIEISPKQIENGILAPAIPGNFHLDSVCEIDGNKILTYTANADSCG